MAKRTEQEQKQTAALMREALLDAIDEKGVVLVLRAKASTARIAALNFYGLRYGLDSLMALSYVQRRLAR